MNNICNENFEVYKKDGSHYLKVDFDFEDDFGIYKCHIDKLNFDFKIKELICESDHNSKNVILKLESKDSYDEISFRTPILSKYSKAVDTLCTFEVVEEKIHELTVEEIEKKLGYKIKIISKSK